MPSARATRAGTAGLGEAKLQLGDGAFLIDLDHARSLDTISSSVLMETQILLGHPHEAGGRREPIAILAPEPFEHLHRLGGSDVV